MYFNAEIVKHILTDDYLINTNEYDLVLISRDELRYVEQFLRLDTSWFVIIA